jgi:hypothetical protein
MSYAFALFRSCSGIGMLILDAIDTLWVTGRQADFDRSKVWIVQEIRARMDKFSSSISVFELIIRAVGGVLSAYDISGDTRLLEIARYIVDKYAPFVFGNFVVKHHTVEAVRLPRLLMDFRLLPAFNTTTQVPFGRLDIQTGKQPKKLRSDVRA